MARAPFPVNRAPLRSNPQARRRASLPAVGLLLALGGCSVFQAPPELRGNRVDAELVRQITPGVQTRQDVTALLGSPSATGTFDQDNWYYISSTSRTRPGRVPGIENQRVVAITFDQAGVVREIRELGESDARNVPVVERQTPVPGTDRTLLQALFGNIGRFNGAGAASGPQGPGGGPGR